MPTLADTLEALTTAALGRAALCAWDDAEALLDAAEDPARLQALAVQLSAPVRLAGEHDVSGEARDEGGKWKAGGTHVAAAKAMRTAHPFPTHEPPTLPPGAGRLDLVAKSPELQAIVKAHDEHAASYQRANVANMIGHMLNSPPDRSVPLPPPGSPRKKLVQRAKMAIEAAGSADAQLQLIALPAFGRYHAAVAGSHAQGQEALDAARDEARRRRAVAVAVARQHIAGLPDDQRSKAERALARAVDSGAIRLAAVADTSWSAYQGPHGGHGWRSASGEVRYQRDQPGGEAHPGAVPHPDSRPPEPPSHGALRRRGDKAARTIWKGTKGLLRSLGAAGTWMKAKTKETYNALERRYGRKQAIAIFAAGHIVGLGVPGFNLVPGSTLLGMAPFAAMAEVYLRARRALGKAPAKLSAERQMSVAEVWHLGAHLAAQLAGEWEEHRRAVRLAAEHDVSGESRDESGKWTAGGAGTTPGQPAEPEPAAEETPHEKAHREWEERASDRDDKREGLDSTQADNDGLSEANVQDWQDVEQAHDSLKAGESTHEDFRRDLNGYLAAQQARLNELENGLETAVGGDKDIDLEPFAKAKKEGLAKVGKTAKAYSAQAAKLEPAATELKALEDSEPDTDAELPEDQLPEEPEEPEAEEELDEPEEPTGPPPPTRDTRDAQGNVIRQRDLDEEPQRNQYERGDGSGVDEEAYKQDHDLWAKWDAEYAAWEETDAPAEREQWKKDHAAWEQDDAEERNQAAQADYEAAHDKWEEKCGSLQDAHQEKLGKAHDKWEAAKEKAEEAVEKHAEKLDELQGEFDEAMTDLISTTTAEADEVLAQCKAGLDDAEADDEEPEEPEEEEEDVQLAAAHAPAGGVNVQGVSFRGGQFIPADVMAEATPEEKAAVAGKSQAAPAAGKEHQGKPQVKHVARLARFRSPTRRRRVIHALRNEAELAKATGAFNLPDSEPADVVMMTSADGEMLTDHRQIKHALMQREQAALMLRRHPEGPVAEQCKRVLSQPCHFVEVKTLLTSPHGKIHMSSKARQRKEQWERRYGAEFSVLIFDDRKGRKQSGNRLYYRRGAKSLRLQDAQPVKSLRDIPDLLFSSEADLPEQARRS